MTQLKQIALLLAVLAIVAFLFLVGAGLVAVAAIIVLCLVVWRRLRRALSREHAPQERHLHVTDVDYVMVEEERPGSKEP